MHVDPPLKRLLPLRIPSIPSILLLLYLPTTNTWTLRILRPLRRLRTLKSRQGSAVGGLLAVRISSLAREGRVRRFLQLERTRKKEVRLKESWRAVLMGNSASRNSLSFVRSSKSSFSSELSEIEHCNGALLLSTEWHLSRLNHDILLAKIHIHGSEYNYLSPVF